MHKLNRNLNGSSKKGCVYNVRVINDHFTILPENKARIKNQIPLKSKYKYWNPNSVDLRR